MIRRFLAALQFLTVLPTPDSTASLGEAAIFFPVAGALLGASTGAVMQISSLGFTPSVSAAISMIWLITATGSLHEDGFADVADAVRAARRRDRMMEILKDSRIGTYGAVALILSILTRWQALAETTVNPIAGLTAALALSRTSMVVLAAFTPSAGTGLGQAFVAVCSPKTALAVAPQAIVIVALAAIYIGWERAVALIAATIVIIFLARRFFVRRLGGVNGDCLGATCQAIEIVNMVILAWHPSF
jgi:adenosylcobinamide-GDP ribazoletransferase